MRSRKAAATAAAATAALALTSFATSPAQADHQKHPGKGRDLSKAVKVEKVHDHLEEFQAIADAHDGNRGAGTSGYEASARYVEKTLKKAGYRTERQYFPFLYEEVEETSLTENSPDSRDVAHTPMSYSNPTPEDGVTGTLAAPEESEGCTADAYGGADLAGQIALVERGTCSFGEKAVAAGEAGAEAVVVYNNEAGELNGTLGEVVEDSAPATGITQEEGQALLGKMANGPVTLSFLLDKTMEERETFNVIAETKHGRDDNVVMVGAHLDGVHDGPGINDNASGTAGTLETAVQLSRSKKVNNTVRFAFWGAEELGLVGSNHYVADLQENDPEALDDIATYLNFDMIASPNHVVGVYDADESTYEAPVEVPEGSIATEKVFTDYFDGNDQPWVDSEFSGRSDYSAFIEAGVPASGLFSGADGVKTEEEVEMFGGTAGELYDPNYHTPEDDIDNINMESLEVMSKAIAHATGSLGQSTETINGKKPCPGKSCDKPGKPGTPGKPGKPGHGHGHGHHSAR